MRKKIKEFRFVPDMMGPIQIYSLQHPIKENEDAYMLPIKKKAGFMTLFHTINKLSFCFEVYITADIEYKYVPNTHKEYREITKMKIKKVELYPHEEEWSK